MGYTTHFLDRVVDRKNFFAEKNICTLGVLYPYVSKKYLKNCFGADLLEVSDRNFSKAVFIDHLKASTISALDISDYQGSEIIFDLNSAPIDPKLKNQFDVIFDLGTIEHLINPYQGLVNIFELIDIGGEYWFDIPCNNWIDHGFFQISPTFYHDLSLQFLGLKLVELGIHVDNRSILIDDLGPCGRTVLNSCFCRVNVWGRIKKVSNEVEPVSVLQAKYADNSADPGHKYLRQIAKYLFSIPIFPLGLRLAVAKLVDVSVR